MRWCSVFSYSVMQHVAHGYSGGQMQFSHQPYVADHQTDFVRKRVFQPGFEYWVISHNRYISAWLVGKENVRYILIQTLLQGIGWIEIGMLFVLIFSYTCNAVWTFLLDYIVFVLFNSSVFVPRMEMLLITPDFII